MKRSVKNQHHLTSDMSSVGDDKVTKDTLNVCIVLLRGLCVVQCYMGTKRGDSLLSREHRRPPV